VPKKRQRLTSPVYGTFIVSLLYRTVFVWQENESASDNIAAEQLERTLAAIFTAPEIKEYLQELRDRLQRQSHGTFQRAARKFVLTQICPLYARTVLKGERRQKFLALSAADKLKFLLETLHYPGTFPDLTDELRRAFFRTLDMVLSGDAADVQRRVGDELKGVFCDDTAAALGTVRAVLLIAGGGRLVRQIDDAAQEIHGALAASKEFRAAAELAEKRYRLGGTSAEGAFQDAWRDLAPRLQKMIRARRLVIPVNEDAHGKTLDEEIMLAMETVFGVLLATAAENPETLVREALEGNLKNWLVTAVRHDLLDKMRAEKAKKRDFRKRVSLPPEERAGYDREGAATAFSPRLPRTRDVLDVVEEKYDLSTLLGKLTREERAIVRRKNRGFTQREIARALGKSPAWVSARLKQIRDKLTRN